MTSSKRVAIIGSTGQLGGDLVQVMSNSGRYMVTPLTHEQLDVTDRGNVTRLLANDSFDVIVNCAAFNRVDECEDRIEEALRVNAQGAFEVARACLGSGTLCVFISSDYVFNGQKGSPYTEEDKPTPLNVYGISKLAGELLVREKASRWLILRISSVFGKSGSRSKGGNFIETILRQARSHGSVQVISDIWMSPTYTMDVARTLDELIQAEAIGIYHCSNAGRCTWFEFASEALRLVGLGTRVEPITSDLILSKARRPKDSSMTSIYLEEILGHSRRSWRESLRDYLIEKGHVAC
jgi:dTDP-4-dehydrorhamnose reductase